MVGSGASLLPTKKLALLKIAQKQLAMEEADYRSILGEFGGVASATQLSLGGFERVIARLTHLGFRSTWTKRTFGNRPGMASATQVDLIRNLWRDYHGDDGDAALSAWLKHFHQVEALRFVTAEIAAKIIPGLKAMARRAQSAR